MFSCSQAETRLGRARVSAQKTRGGELSKTRGEEASTLTCRAPGTGPTPGTAGPAPAGSQSRHTGCTPTSLWPDQRLKERKTKEPSWCSRPEYRIWASHKSPGKQHEPLRSPARAPCTGTGSAVPRPPVPCPLPQAPVTSGWQRAPGRVGARGLLPCPRGGVPGFRSRPRRTPERRSPGD